MFTSRYRMSCRQSSKFSSFCWLTPNLNAFMSLAFWLFSISKATSSSTSRFTISLMAFFQLSPESSLSYLFSFSCICSISFLVSERSAMSTFVFSFTSFSTLVYSSFQIASTIWMIDCWIRVYSESTVLLMFLLNSSRVALAVAISLLSLLESLMMYSLISFLAPEKCDLSVSDQLSTYSFARYFFLCSSSLELQKLGRGSALFLFLYEQGSQQSLSSELLIYIFFRLDIRIEVEESCCLLREDWEWLRERERSFLTREPLVRNYLRPVRIRGIKLILGGFGFLEVFMEINLITLEQIL